MKTKLRAWGLSLGCLLLVSLYPCLFQYSTNLPESRFSDAAVFWGIFAGIGLIAFCVCLLILRRVEAASVRVVTPLRVPDGRVPTTRLVVVPLCPSLL